jgi:hypothetical protein
MYEPLPLYCSGGLPALYGESGSALGKYDKNFLTPYTLTDDSLLRNSHWTMSSTQTSSVDITPDTLIGFKKRITRLGLRQYGTHSRDHMEVHNEDCPYCTDSAFQNARKEGAVELIEPTVEMGKLTLDESNTGDSGDSVIFSAPIRPIPLELATGISTLPNSTPCSETQSPSQTIRALTSSSPTTPHHPSSSTPTTLHSNTSMNPLPPSIRTINKGLEVPQVSLEHFKGTY